MAVVAKFVIHKSMKAVSVRKTLRIEIVLMFIDSSYSFVIPTYRVGLALAII
jgi:hypothetical protein